MTLEKLLRMEVPAKDKDGNVIKITPEFRLAVQDLECVVDGKKGVRVIVHANGHNSDTVDLWVCGNQTRKFYSEAPGYAKNKIQMTYQLYGRCMWHSDCEPGNGSGVMKGIKREDDGDVFECLHCGKKGFYPVGGVGCITVDEIEA